MNNVGLEIIGSNILNTGHLYLFFLLLNLFMINLCKEWDLVFNFNDLLLSCVCFPIFYNTKCSDEKYLKARFENLLQTGTILKFLLYSVEMSEFCFKHNNLKKRDKSIGER